MQSAYNIKSIFGIALVLILSSCSQKLIPFTTDVEKKLALSEEHLVKVQFYTSDDIVLYKTTEDQLTSIENGKLVVLNRKDNENIIIRKNTPCILEKVLNSHNFVVSFEYGAGKILAFGSDSTGGYFTLMAKDWKNKTGTLKYANQTYITTNGNVFLQFSMKSINRLNSKYKVVYGRRL